MTPLDQCTLFPRRGEASIRERFEQFHAANPAVYAKLRELALRAQGRGKRVGMKCLWEMLRYYTSVETVSADEFKLNNDFTSRYARLLMEREPELLGYFDLREIHA